MFLTLMVAAMLLGGSVSGGAQDERPNRITLEEFRKLLEGGDPLLILDVRGEISSKIKGAKHVPLDALESRLEELPRDREIITYCA